MSSVPANRDEFRVAIGEREVYLPPLQRLVAACRPVLEAVDRYLASEGDPFHVLNATMSPVQHYLFTLHATSANPPADNGFPAGEVRPHGNYKKDDFEALLYQRDTHITNKHRVEPPAVELDAWYWETFLRLTPEERASDPARNLLRQLALGVEAQINHIDSIAFPPLTPYDPSRAGGA